MELHRNEKGQMLVMTAIELIMIFGFLAIAADVGVLFHSKRKMQIATDAAATAAALNNYYASGGYTSSSMTDTLAACQAMEANGYATAADCTPTVGETISAGSPNTFKGIDGVKVTVSEPPGDGYHQDAGYVEVVMTKPNPLYFFRVFTGNKTAIVATRAVAGDPEGAAGCVYTGNMYLGGNGTIEGAQSASKTSCDTAAQKACGIYVGGTATSLDNGSLVCANFVDALSGSGTQFTTQPTGTTLVDKNPLQPYANSYMPDPSSTGADSSMCTSGTGGAYGTSTYNGNIYPLATYTGGTLPTPITYHYTHTITVNSTSVTISGYIDNVYCFSQPITIGASGTTTKLDKHGFYVFMQGATLDGQVIFGQNSSTNQCDNTGSSSYGAVIYNSSGVLQMGGSTSQLAACAPTNKQTDEGTPNEYNGIAIFQPWPVPSGSTNNSNNLELVFGDSGMATGTCSLSDASLNGWIVAPGAAVLMHDQGGGVTVTGIVSASIGTPNQKLGGTGGNGGANGTMNICNYNTVNSATTPFKVVNLVE